MFLKVLSEKQPTISKNKGKSAHQLKLKTAIVFQKRNNLFSFWTLIECILLTSKADIDSI